MSTVYTIFICRWSKNRLSHSDEAPTKATIRSARAGTGRFVCKSNLNTHSIASFYKAFTPDEAFRLSQKLEIHYTPKHGSWLDIAEIELSALTTQCLLGVRIPSIDDLNKELSLWSSARNSFQKSVSWQFTSSDARIKLKHLYPEIRF
ncbi:MAG: transposase [Clostridia bacterium]|nr:transposase [Clostridia bacterium]